MCGNNGVALEAKTRNSTSFTMSDVFDAFVVSVRFVNDFINAGSSCKYSSIVNHIDISC